MKRILVTDAGRSPALNYCRALRISNEDYFIVGIDSNKYSLTWAEADVKLLVPSCDCERYIDLLNNIIDKYKINFIYPSKTGKELLLISDNREKMHAKVCLPDKEDINLFEDKWKTYEILSESGICAMPKSYLVYAESDLYEHMKELSNSFSKEVWLRRIYGSGGACAIATDDFELAKCWVRRYNGWGKFMISKKLTKKTLTWSGIWNNGKLEISLIRERLYWEFADRSPAGVTGITGAQRVIKDNKIHEQSVKIINYLSKKPHGAICVDYTIDENGVPNLTEIQASRLYTSSYFMAKCGLNFPDILCKVGLNEEITDDDLGCCILDENKIWLKYVETYPDIVDVSTLEENEHERDRLLNEVMRNA